MTATLGKATAAPEPRTVNGRTWLVHPLTFEDLGRFEKWCEAECLRTTLDALARMDESERAVILADAMKDTPRGPFACQAMMRTPRGQTMLACLSLRKGDPTITPEGFHEALPAPEHVTEIVNLVVMLSMPDAGEKSGGGEGVIPF